jgi:hypothetical protein
VPVCLELGDAVETRMQLPGTFEPSAPLELVETIPSNSKRPRNTKAHSELGERSLDKGDTGRMVKIVAVLSGEAPGVRRGLVELQRWRKLELGINPRKTDMRVPHSSQGPTPRD